MLRNILLAALFLVAAPAGADSISVTPDGISRVVIQSFCAANCTTTVAGGGTGTYTPTSGMRYAQIECIGGGGAGGGVAGASSQAYGGGGGSAGSYARIISTAATIGASQTVTIGAGGTGVSGDNSGGAGGDSSLGSICVGKGGNGGLGCPTGSCAAGNLTAVGTGTVLVAGTMGTPGPRTASTGFVTITGGYGAPSYLGGGSKGALTSGAAAAGSNGAGYGAGGGGAAALNNASNAAGGDGAAGIVIITEYLN